MALITYVTDRATGERSGGFQDNTISLSGVSDVRLDIEREDIASWEQKGDDLVVTLQDGTQILIENFYASDDSGLVSRLLVKSYAQKLVTALVRRRLEVA